MKTKTCSVCNRDLPLDNFYKYMRKCKTCYCSITHAYYMSHRDQTAKTAKKRAINNPYRHWTKNTLSAHRRRKHNIINITTDQLERLAISTTHCAICGTELVWKSYKGTFFDNSPSLDRINNENTINLDNILIVCKRCNVSKYNRTFNEFVLYCKHVSNIWGDKLDV